MQFSSSDDDDDDNKNKQSKPVTITNYIVSVIPTSKKHVFT
jgi:hypothetical protein